MNDSPAIPLFRPVGLLELELIMETEMKAFPPRLPDQPIFYPVMNQQYAQRIAQEWNTQSGACAGFVTRFYMPATYLQKFEVQIVGDRSCEELWVPAETLAEFNNTIVGRIEVIAAFYGEGYNGPADTTGDMASLPIPRQLEIIRANAKRNHI